jgi:hypothetical protein
MLFHGSSARTGWVKELAGYCLAATAGEDRRQAGQARAVLWLMLAESHLRRRLFGAMVRRIAALPGPTG